MPVRTNRNVPYGFLLAVFALTSCVQNLNTSDESQSTQVEACLDHCAKAFQSQSQACEELDVSDISTADVKAVCLKSSSDARGKCHQECRAGTHSHTP